LPVPCVPAEFIFDWTWLRKRWSQSAIYGALALQVGLVAWFAATHIPYDLNVYLWGGHAVAGDQHLYLTRVHTSWFTYPPFAAVIFAPVSAVPVGIARAAWELASIAAFAVSCVTTLKLAGYHASRTAVAALVALGLLLEPVWHTLYLGQVNLFLLALILTDVRRASRGQPAGIGIGLAAAIKLTPAIFIILLLLTRRTRAALTAAAAFAACGLIGYLVAPAASRLYWTKLCYDTGRLGAAYISNQSPYGAADRILGGLAHVGPWYVLVALTIGGIGLAAAIAVGRRGDWLGAAAVTGVTGLLVSPISWTHHWVWIMPAIAVLARGGAGSRIAAAGGYLLFVLALPWWAPRADYSREYGFHGLATLTANSYLIAGLAFLAYMAVRAFWPRPDAPAALPSSSRDRQPALHAGQQLVGVDGLGDVIAGSGGQALVPVALHGPGGDGDDRQVSELRHLADRGGGGVAIHLGHHHVHQHEIDVIAGLQDLDTLMPARRVDHGEPVELQDAGDRERVPQVVIDDEHPPAAHPVVQPGLGHRAGH
jgi:hypothetical protein